MIISHLRHSPSSGALRDPRFEHGLLQPSPKGVAPVGLQLPQPLLTEGEATHYFDVDLGTGFALILAPGSDDLATFVIRASLDRIGGRCVAAPDTPEHPLWALLAEHPAILVRPDRHIYGLAHTPSEVDTLAVTLSAQLSHEA